MRRSLIWSKVLSGRVFPDTKSSDLLLHALFQSLQITLPSALHTFEMPPVTRTGDSAESTPDGDGLPLAGRIAVRAGG
jgi:hypothetical protein